MYKKHDVKLTLEERNIVQQTISNKKSSIKAKKRATVLLLADSVAGKPMTQAEISKRCGVSDVTVFKVVRDYCTNGLEYTLKFKRTKATNPPIVDGSKEARIIATACGEVPEGYAQWSIRLLTEKVIELKIMDKVSRETIRNVLKKHNLSLT